MSKKIKINLLIFATLLMTISGSIPVSANTVSDPSDNPQDTVLTSTVSTVLAPAEILIIHWPWSYTYDIFSDIANNIGKNVETTTFTTTITSGLLANYEILMLSEPNRYLTAEEINAILDFVDKGGGLILAVDHQYQQTNPLSTNFGIDFSALSFSGTFWFSSHDVVNNPNVITFIDTVPDYRSDGYLITTEEVVVRLGGYDFVAVTTYGKGRVVAIAEDEVLLDEWGIEDQENQEFAENILLWLQGGAMCNHSNFNCGR